MSNTTEITAVAEAMNRMAGLLADRIGVIERQRNEAEAVLTSKSPDAAIRTEILPRL